jgi:hypothetical protein
MTLKIYLLIEKWRSLALQYDPETGRSSHEHQNELDAEIQRRCQEVNEMAALEERINSG